MGTESLFSFARLRGRIGVYRGPYTPLYVWAFGLNMTFRDSSFDESHRPTSHIEVGRLMLAWVHRG